MGSPHSTPFPPIASPISACGKYVQLATNKKPVEYYFLNVITSFPCSVQSSPKLLHCLSTDVLEEALLMWEPLLQQLHPDMPCLWESQSNLLPTSLLHPTASHNRSSQLERGKCPRLRNKCSSHQPGSQQLYKGNLALRLSLPRWLSCPHFQVTCSLGQAVLCSGS